MATAATPVAIPTTTTTKSVLGKRPLDPEIDAPIKRFKPEKRPEDAVYDAIEQRDFDVLTLVLADFTLKNTFKAYPAQCLEAVVDLLKEEFTSLVGGIPFQEYFATDAKVPEKKFLANVLMAGWLSPQMVQWPLMVFAMFADLPVFKTWMKEQVRKYPAAELSLDALFDDKSVVQWAYRLGNIPMLEWCFQARDAENAMLFPKKDYWRLADFDEDDLNEAPPTSHQWWVSVFGASDEEDEDEDEDEDNDDDE